MMMWDATMSAATTNVLYIAATITFILHMPQIHNLSTH